MTVFVDTAENFHPWECDGPGRCRHCDQHKDDTHDPATCALCEPIEPVAEEAGKQPEEMETSDA